jgi:hypothetical protein
MSKCKVVSVVVVLIFLRLNSLVVAQERFEFTRMVAHWAKYGGPDYLTFIKDAQPEVVQHGFYGGHFWSLAHTPQYKGYPSHFPVQGLSECGKWMEDRNAALHKLDAKVIGHFNVEFLVGEPDGKNGAKGFFHFYNNLWDAKVLGPKPVENPLDFLEKKADGTPIINNSYSIGGMREYWACLRNPSWQKVLKAWVKHGVDRGLDGFIANYFYRHNCHCEHCQTGFREYLADRFDKQELSQRFSIKDVKQHKFDEIVCWHKPAESTPLRREMLRWSQISNKQVFDEVFVKYGRSLKPDLIVAQWNHLGNFSQINGDERCMLPSDVWGQSEDYLWYSLGGSAFFTDLEKRFLGEGTLQARYIRGAFDDKPFTLGKYENTRIRVAIAELAANGGAPMGFYTRFTDPEARKVIVQYYQFLKRYDSVFKANRPYAESVLMFPRKAIHAGNLKPLDQFREVGRHLLESHVLFDVVPDDLGKSDSSSDGYATKYLADHNFDTHPIPKDATQIDAPFTVRVSASRPANSEKEVTLHFVNYNRKEPARGRNGKPSAGRGIKDEQPIPVEGVRVNFRLPPKRQLDFVEFCTPEKSQSLKIDAQQIGDRVKMSVPKFDVYAILRVHLK